MHCQRGIKDPVADTKWLRLALFKSHYKSKKFELYEKGDAAEFFDDFIQQLTDAHSKVAKSYILQVITA